MHQSFLKRFLLFIWLLFAVSSVSNFRPDTAGGGDLLFSFASSVQSCSGEAGRCRQTSLCVDSTHRVPATLGLPRPGVSVLSPSTLLRLPAALYGAPCVACGSSFLVLHKSADSVAPVFCAFPGLSVSGSQRLGRPLPRCGAPFPSAASGSGSQRLGHPLPRCGAPFPSAAPARAAGRVSESLQTGTGACLLGGRGWPLWG